MWLRVLLNHVEAKRKERVMRAVKVENEIKLKGRLKERPIKLGNIDKCLCFEFEFKTNYVSMGKRVASILIRGEVIYIDEPERMKALKEAWKRKRMEAKEMELILNAALMEAQVMAIMIARQLMLPLPVPLPRARAVSVPREIG